METINVQKRDFNVKVKNETIRDGSWRCVW